MPVTYTEGEFGYTDIRVGTDHNIHQIAVSDEVINGYLDADGSLPPGIPLARGTEANVGVHGVPVEAGGYAVWVTGPEPHELDYDPIESGEAVEQVNVFLDGGLNRDAMEFNLGRALTADELASLDGTQGGNFTLHYSGPTQVTT